MEMKLEALIVHKEEQAYKRIIEKYKISDIVSEHMAEAAAWMQSLGNREPLIFVLLEVGRES